MATLRQKIERAHREKPAPGAKCNRCGWCCLTEVCPAGVEVTGTTQIPCRLLKGRPGKYRCSLASNDRAKKLLGIGTGCCAITVEEKLEFLGINIEVNRYESTSNKTR